MQDLSQKILRTMVTHGENRFCFDCNQRSPTYVNMTIGSFVCTNCGGALRKYNHRVKSISMSNFSQADIEFLCTRGNKLCRRIYLALSDEHDFVEKDLKDEMLDNYLRQKYQAKKWYRDPPRQLEAEILKENKELVEQAERNSSNKCSKSAGGNTAAGLIVLPTRSSVVNVTPKQNTGKSDAQPKVNAVNGQTQATQPPLDPFASSQPENFAQFTTTATKNSSTTAPTNGDPFASLISQPFPNSPQLPGSSTAGENSKGQDFFSSSYSPEPNKTHNIAAQAPNFPTTVGTMPWATAPTTAPSYAPMNNTPHTGDKYAALAELDGLFKSASINPSMPAQNNDRNAAASIRTNNANASININPWPANYGLTSTTSTGVSASQPVSTNLWPSTTAIPKDNLRPSNPFTSNAAPACDSAAAAFRLSNPFAQYNPYSSSSPVPNYVSNPVAFDSVRVSAPNPKNPFATQMNQANPFGVTSNPNFVTNLQPISSQSVQAPNNNLFGVNGTTDNFGLFNFSTNSNIGPTTSSLSNFSPF